MAKTKSNGGVRSIIADIRNGNPANVYVLHGEEPYYIDLIVSNIEKYAIPEDDRDFNLDIFYGNDADVDYVIGSARQLPVMASRKLVILKEAQSMNQAKSSLDKFAPYVARPNESAIFVIAFKGDSLNATSDLIKSAKKSGAVVFKSDIPTDWNLENVAKDHCVTNRISIEEKALRMICESVGAPLSKLFGEIGKLASIKGANARITAEDVEKHVGISKDFTNFELASAVAARDYPRAMRIVKYYESNPKQTKTNSHSMTTAGILLNFFTNLLAAHYVQDKSDSALMEALGFKASIQLRDIRMGLRNYSALKTVQAIRYIRDFDTKSKGVESFMSGTDLLAEMIFKIFT